MKYDDIEGIDDLGVQCLCDYFTDRMRTKTYRKGLAIPMLICACLSDDKKIDESAIKKMLKQIDMDKEEKRVTIKMCLLVLRDLYANDEMFYESRYEKKLIGWFE